MEDDLNAICYHDHLRLGMKKRSLSRQAFRLIERNGKENQGWGRWAITPLYPRR